MRERENQGFFNKVGAGVTGQSTPPAGLYPGLKRPRLDYTRLYYGLGQFIYIFSARMIWKCIPAPIFLQKALYIIFII